MSLPARDQPPTRLARFHLLQRFRPHFGLVLVTGNPYWDAYMTFAIGILLVLIAKSPSDPGRRNAMS